MAEITYPDKTHDAPINPARQRRIGLTLASLILTAWIALHIYTVFLFKLSWDTALPAVLLVALQTWLYVGIFIVAHDCMHGSLVPFNPKANRAIGGLCLFLYAGFSFDALNTAHHRHHRYPGSAADPDFDANPPHGFWPWFVKFFVTYFSWTQIAIILGVYALYVGALGVNQWNTVVFWAVPGLLSALQLFTFGTYLPHRPDAHGFDDRHNARSNDFSPLMSLLTCFHFGGYHHEHHLFPTLPWWRLPSVRLGKGT